MPTFNPWLNPLQRSYSQIKAKLIESLKLTVPEITDFSEGNIFMIIISIFAAIAEVLHYYIDNMGSETFFVTARKYSSLKKHTKMVDYHIRSANPSQVDLTISLTDGKVIGMDVTIPTGLIFTTSDGTPFISSKLIVWRKGTYDVVIPVIQKEIVEEVNFGINTSDSILIYLGDLGTNMYYVEGSMVLALNNDQWELVDTFAYSKPNSKHFMVELDDSYLPYIKFGDGKYGLKPPINNTIIGSFYKTYGTGGNVAQGSITSVPQILFSSVNDQSLTSINLLGATGGSNYENFDMVKEHMPLSIKTLGVAISKDDYESIAKLSPGVDKAFCNYLCGKFLEIYITPDGGGIASSGLCSTTYAYILKRKVLTTFITILPTKEADIVIAATITGKRSFKTNDISLQVINALFQAYSYNTSDIAKTVRLSDIYAMIDNLPMVDYLKIDNLYIRPIYTKVGSNARDLNNLTTITKIVNTTTYLLRYNSNDGKIYLLLSNLQQTGLSLTIGTSTKITLNGNNWDILINNPTNGTYSNGDTWRFTLQESGVDQEITSFTIPIFKSESDINLTITEVV